MTTKKLMCTNLESGARSLVVTYTLHGGKVELAFADPHMVDFFEPSIVDRGTVLRPEDGSRYFEALERAYSASSTYSIEPA
jgi:hypothetical protein